METVFLNSGNGIILVLIVYILILKRKTRRNKNSNLAVIKNNQSAKPIIKNNNDELIGTISKVPTFHHESMGTRFYMTKLKPSDAARGNEVTIIFDEKMFQIVNPCNKKPFISLQKPQEYLVSGRWSLFTDNDTKETINFLKTNKIIEIR